MTDSGTQKVRCPHCLRKLRAPNAFIGKRAKCPQCKTPFLFEALGEFELADEFELIDDDGTTLINQQAMIEPKKLSGGTTVEQLANEQSDDPFASTIASPSESTTTQDLPRQKPSIPASPKIASDNPFDDDDLPGFADEPAPAPVQPAKPTSNQNKAPVKPTAKPVAKAPVTKPAPKAAPPASRRGPPPRKSSRHDDDDIILLDDDDEVDDIILLDDDDDVKKPKRKPRR